MYRHGIFLSYPLVIFALTYLPSKASPSHERTVLCIANTHQSIRCIHIDENKILSGKHIIGIYQVYIWHIQGKCIYLVYTRYIPWKNFLGVPDGDPGPVTTGREAADSEAPAGEPTWTGPNFKLKLLRRADSEVTRRPPGPSGITWSCPSHGTQFRPRSQLESQMKMLR